jgi:hypothetical protein
MGAPYIMARGVSVPGRPEIAGCGWSLMSAFHPFLPLAPGVGSTSLEVAVAAGPLVVALDSELTYGPLYASILQNAQSRSTMPETLGSRS